MPTPGLAEIEAMPLASLVSPLVVQEDGWVVPIQHGFGNDFGSAFSDKRLPSTLKGPSSGP